MERGRERLDDAFQYRETGIEGPFRRDKRQTPPVQTEKEQCAIERRRRKNELQNALQLDGRSWRVKRNRDGGWTKPALTRVPNMIATWEGSILWTNDKQEDGWMIYKGRTEPEGHSLPEILRWKVRKAGDVESYYRPYVRWLCGDIGLWADFLKQLKRNDPVALLIELKHQQEAYNRNGYH